MAFPAAPLVSVNKGSSGTSSAIDTTGATLILVAVGDEYNGTFTTVTDSKANVYQLVARAPLLGLDASCQGSLWACFAPTVGSGHTFTVNAGSTFPSFCVDAWSNAGGGISIAPKFANTGGATSLAPGSVTPTTNGCLVVAALAYRDTTTVSINASFTISTQNPFVGGTAIGSALAYLVQTTAAAANPTFSWTNSALASAEIAAFEVSVAASTGGGAWGYA